jgi:hypothetical protein
MGELKIREQQSIGVHSCCEEMDATRTCRWVDTNLRKEELSIPLDKVSWPTLSPTYHGYKSTRGRLLEHRGK